MIDEESVLYQEVRRCESVVSRRKRSGKEPCPEADLRLEDARYALKAWRAEHDLLGPDGKRISGLAPAKRKVDRSIPLRDLNAARVAAATARGPRLGGRTV